MPDLVQTACAKPRHICRGQKQPKRCTQYFDAEMYSVWKTQPNRDIHVVVRFLRAAYCRGVQRLEFWVSCRGVDVAREKCPPPMQVLCHTLDVLEWLCVQRLGAGGYQVTPPCLRMAKVGTALA